MRQVIIKFGGTSVSSRVMWEHIKTITENHIAQGTQPIIVCSALSQASNKLEEMINTALLDKHHTLHTGLTQSYNTLAQELDVDPAYIKTDLLQLKQWLTGIALLNEAPAKTRAQILSLGEIMLTRLGHAFLEKNNISTHWFDARKALITNPIFSNEDMNYLHAHCEGASNPNLAYQLANNGASVVITQGFIASNPAGETVLLGRGGSDTSATLLAACLEADACEIWTDVPGIYTANPRQLPHARLLKQLNYDEAQEIASMGAKVLHPPCIPPVRRANIPLFVKYTCLPEHLGTRITQESDPAAPPIKSIQIMHSITLISIDALTMWQQVGFLSNIFDTFKRHHISINLLSSSEFNVTLSLDNNVPRARNALNALLIDLNQLGRAKIIEPCCAVSLVGHHIRTVLPQLGPALEVFEAKKIYLMSLASNDLNLTFVVDEEQADKLVQQLHALLIENNPQSFYYSQSWQEQFGTPAKHAKPWWETERNTLLSMAKKEAPCYIYNMPTLEERADTLRKLHNIDQCFYAIKANPHPDILKRLEAKGIGFECVSIQELNHVLQLFPNIHPTRLLFTPNFAPKEEYAYACAIGCHLTIDSLYPLEHWPELFKSTPVLLRIDPGCGAGHHKYVCTGGNESKFGIPRSSLGQAADLVKTHNICVIGLHSHSGSGILSPNLWQETALMLYEEAKNFPDARIINLGGGLGIAEKPGQYPLDMAAIDASLEAVKSRDPNWTFWLEPGRFFVAESGVILAHVTQCKIKGKVRFIGIDVGMNSLIRPMLYGAYHEIVNLTRFTEEKTSFAHVVGPICESADTLGYDRLLPETHEGDILLIANAGAYGHCMSSSYNLRPPAKEVILDAC